jgi:hypothetical protein
MASPLFPALAAGALLALLAQIPPSLNAAQHWLPVVLRTASSSPEREGTGGSDGLGSLSHRAPRHAASRVLHRSHGDARGGIATAPAASTVPLRPPGKAPRRPWGISSHAFSGAPFSGPAQAGGLSPQSAQAQTSASRAAQR